MEEDPCSQRSSATHRPLQHAAFSPLAAANFVTSLNYSLFAIARNIAITRNKAV